MSQKKYVIREFENEMDDDGKVLAIFDSMEELDLFIDVTTDNILEEDTLWGVEVFDPEFQIQKINEMKEEIKNLDESTLIK